MTFTAPLALLLLAAVPLVVALGWPPSRFRRRRDLASLALRALIVTLLVLALAGAQVIRSADRLAAIFLVDVSDSIAPPQREAMLQYVRDALASLPPDDLAGIVVFGGSALVERAPSGLRDWNRIESIPNTGNTDLAEAIRLGLALFPQDTARRLVILSDGRQTAGDALTAAELAAATGVEISYVSFAAQESAPDVQVTEVRAPSAVNAGQAFDLGITLQAEAAVPATITVLQSGAIIHRETVELRQGANRYALPLAGGGAGFQDFQVQVDPAGGDRFYQNNRLSAFTRVIGPPRVLVMANAPEDARYLAPALEQAGLTVDVAAPEQLPVGLAALAPYQAVVLADVPAVRLSPARMVALQTFVRDLGGGLVVVGGPNAYGPGGYFRTPLEETLPLEMQIRDQQRLPQLTIAYVIDRSGSMGIAGPSGVPNLELAKEAIIRSIDFLQPTDRAGVVGFDTQGYWIADVQPVSDRFALQRLVATLRTGGGTDILAGMNLVAQTIANDPSQRKHIILLTDGGANPTGLVELAGQLNENSGVTTSVIAIGQGAAAFLERMARAGGGNYHAVEIVEQIPTIFTVETVLATRSYILEETFVPVLTASSPIMQGIAAAPPLLGYVAAAPKQTAQVILRGPAPYSDPLLAAWQYGLGRAVAFTSDATARWAANWVTWGDFVRFWNQAVRWTITEGASENIETRVVMEGEQARLVVDARDAGGAYLNGLNLELSLVNPQAQAVRLPLRQVAPGRYEAVFDPGDEGAYLLRVQGQAADAAISQTTGWVLGYSAEYDLEAGRADGERLLRELAALTGGRSLAGEPSAAFAHNLASRAAPTPVGPWLLLTTLLLLPLDVALRRLLVTRSDLERLRAALFGRSQPAAPSERLAALREAKARGRQRAEERAVEAAGPSQAGRQEAETAGERPPAPVRPAPGEGGNLAGELLKKRRQRDT